MEPLPCAETSQDTRETLRVSSIPYSVNPSSQIYLPLQFRAAYFSTIQRSCASTHKPIPYQFYVQAKAEINYLHVLEKKRIT